MYFIRYTLQLQSSNMLMCAQKTLPSPNPSLSLQKKTVRGVPLALMHE